MSELHIKRQTIRKEIRRKQILEYMNKCRQQLVDKHPVIPLEVLTPEQLDALYDELEHQNYSTCSMINFLQTVKNRNATSFNQPALFVRLKYILQYMEDQQSKAIAKNIVQNICQRVVAEGVRNKSFLENIFRQFIFLIGIQDFQLQTIWPSVGLIRNQIFFRQSFNWFIEFIGCYSSDVLGMIGPVIETMLNFTIDLQKQQKMMLSNNQYLSIIDSIEKILHSYCLQLEEIEMSRIAFTIINIIKIFPFEEGLKIVKIKHLLVYLLRYVQKIRETEHFSKNCAMKSILELIGLSLSGSQLSTSQIVHTNPKIFEILCKLLPIDVSFKKIQIPRPVQWTHQNNQIILRVMLSLSNLASNNKLCFQIIANGTFGLVVELSAFPSSLVKEQTAIFLWNMMIRDQEELTSLLCDNGALYIICNAFSAEHSNDSLIYSLKCLLSILKSASSFSSSSSFWHFSLPVIRNILIQSQAYRIIEHLCISDNSKISNMAAECLDILQ